MTTTTTTTTTKSSSSSNRSQSLQSQSQSQIPVPPNPHHRKVDLQSPQDLTYLQRNIRAAAAQKLSLHFPQHVSSPSHGGQDPVRAEVERLVEEFILRTYDLARANVSVNGMDIGEEEVMMAGGLVRGGGGQKREGEEEKEKEKEEDGGGGGKEKEERVEYEAYDPKLAAKVQGLYAQVETLTAKVAEMRRARPREDANGYVEELRRRLDGDEVAFREVVDKEEEKEAERNQGGVLIVKRPERWEETRERYEMASTEMMDGVGKMGETVGRVERAGAVLEGVGL